MTPQQLPALLNDVKSTIDANADEVAALDQEIGDGDHIANLQRGLNALIVIENELAAMDWSAALSKVGMTLMSTMGGASGSLFGSLFLAMGKAAKDKDMNPASIAEVFAAGVESVKQRGKADIGEKTMLDTLIPVSQALLNQAAFDEIKAVAIQGMESTKDMLATKGRASFLGERARGHIDAGARTSQLMICAIVDFVAK
jgi:dihydroxyacetone kinase-like protein